MSCNYPNRPDDLEDLCLHDFVANYDSHSKDSQGRRIYRKVTKPRLVSQKMFDPKKEDQRESYFYSLLLLFVPFRDESSLFQEQETAEEAFKRLLPANVECSAYHARLQAMLKAQEISKPSQMQENCQYQRNMVTTRVMTSLNLWVRPKQQCRIFRT